MKTSPTSGLSKRGARTFHYTASTGVAACGSRLGPIHLGSSAPDLVQVAARHSGSACLPCTSHARELIAARQSGYGHAARLADRSWIADGYAEVKAALR